MRLWKTAVWALAVAPVAVAAPREVPKADVAALEKRLAERPDDLALRDRLLLAYLLDETPDGRAARARHVRWVIANAPDSDLAGRGHAVLDHWREPQEYERAKALWLGQVERRGDSAKVLANASGFFTIADDARARALLERAVDLEPENPEWRRRLGHLHDLEGSNRDATSQSVRDSLQRYQEALARTKDDEGRYLLLDSVAEAARRAGRFDDARTHALELLELAEALPRDWNYGNAVHDGHRILGHVALSRGDVEGAKEELLAAGATPGSPQLNSFGPELTLAKDLLAAGERATVVAYLQDCARFWKTRGPQLQEWIAAIEAGRNPKLDRFAFGSQP